MVIPVGWNNFLYWMVYKSTGHLNNDNCPPIRCYFNHNFKSTQRPLCVGPQDVRNSHSSAVGCVSLLVLLLCTNRRRHLGKAQPATRLYFSPSANHRVFIVMILIIIWYSGTVQGGC